MDENSVHEPAAAQTVRIGLQLLLRADCGIVCLAFEI